MILPLVVGGAVLLRPDAAHASLRMVPGGSGDSGPGPVVRFSVEIERGIDEPGWRVARDIEERMFDHRSWGAEGRRSFRRVSRGRVDVRFVLVSPGTTDRMCAPLQTAGTWNCMAGRTVVINHARWMVPRWTYAGHQDEYRTLILMHEYGHALGHGHVGCSGAGRLASPMMQQGKGLGGCRRNPWPYPRAPRMRTTCTMQVQRTTSPHFLRIVGRVRYVGRRTVVRLQQRRVGSWARFAAASTDVHGRFAIVRRAGAGMLRMQWPGSPSRRACSAAVGPAAGGRPRAAGHEPPATSR